MTDWYVGQKVCCVADFNLRAAHIRTQTLFWTRRGRVPLKGSVYEVSGVYSSDRLISGVGLRLVGFLPDLGLSSAFFRPIVDTKNDISIFTEILDRVNRHEVVDA